MRRIRDADPLASSARRLLDDLDARPLSARSLLLSFLLGTHPPDVSAARLVDVGRLFGLRPGTVRTALSRMVAAGDATAEHGRYRLAGRLLDRQREQDRGLHPTDVRWDRTWWTAIVTADDRTATERRHFRSAMVGARLGELRPDLWMRPANVPEPEPRSGLLITRGPLVSGDEAGLVDRLWDVGAIEATSLRLTEVIEPLGDALEDERVEPATVLPTLFEVSAACVRHLRVEPQLPPSLASMPASRELRRTYADINRRFRAALDEYLRGEPDDGDSA